ncbi:phage tail tape measure protein [Burkholderia pseudomallei]|uniref:phage tail tape measure protein n=1 Tax=Burkholderia pseudomallei TaxID=28450 RepID=UPI000A1A1CF7|nr:phage tail tape measure protein [Burkholderia pseudomallei]ARK42652.1 phage tail tape measure protein [Burkholderia pseudomallei]
MAAATPFVVTITAVDKATANVRKIKASFANLTKPARDLKSSFSNFGKEVGLDRVAKSMKSVGTAAADTARSVASLITPLTAIAGIGSIAGIALLANEWGKMGAEVERTSGVLGVSTDDLQAFRGAAKLAGLSAEDMTGSLKSLGRTIEDATFGRNQDALVMMHKFGISLHRTKDGAVDATRALKEVANAIVAQKGNVQAQSLIAGAFGVESLLPLLQKGGGGIDAFVKQAKELGLVFDKQTLSKGRKFNANMLHLEAAATRLKYSFGDALAPAVEKVLNVVGRLVDKYGDIVATRISEYVERFAKWVDGVDWDKTAKGIGDFVDALGGVKGVAAVIAAITFAGPIGGVLNLVSSLVTLTTLTIPAAVTALGTLGLAGIAAWAALKVAKLAGLPDVDNTQGIDDVRNGDWLAASTHLPAGDFLRALAAHMSGTSNSDIAASLEAGGNPSAAAIGDTKVPLGIRSNNPLNILNNGNERTYATPEEGIAAATANLRRRYGGLTLAQIADKWTGGARTGNTPEQMANYTGLLSKGTGLSADQVPNLNDRATLAGLIKSQIRAENGVQPYTDSQIGAGVDKGLQVDVHLHNAPAGTKATATVRSGKGSARVSTSNVTGPSV